ncbi:PX-associated domain protein [Kalmanozyma brasiliensis GHG001]|uniref:PX domain-containing protein n=1 Tax=Kalmanozyma brasiliensis (strain GHG001) TaxID=1365824 RepID=V5GQJ6_KALBG|nr:PX-associated domain protein [Kalmanozyma brasiliensis GHG001]EST08212.1 PX-associated domain protein [Kalmanozyma brasiliensis GHG001]
MRRPYVEPGHRSARPGIRHRSRQDGPDRKGRDPNTLGRNGSDRRPARLVSDRDSETETTDSYIEDDDDQGFRTDENAVTANEELDDDDDDETSIVDSSVTGASVTDSSVGSAGRSRPAPAIRGAGTRAVQDSEDDSEDDSDDDDDASTDAPTPRNQSRSNLAAATPRSRPRAYSRSNKLAPEDEGWAPEGGAPKERRKGGILGRLTRIGRKRKGSSPPAAQSRQAANTDLVLGRSYGAVRELRSRKSNVGQRPTSMISNGTGDRRRGAAAAAAVGAVASGAGVTGRSAARSSNLASSRSTSGRGGFEDDFDSELGSAPPRGAGLRARQPPSTIASDDATDLVDRDDAPLQTSDVPPRIPLPIALRDAENARSPEIVDPFGERAATKQSHVRSKSVAESVQPSVLDSSDSASLARPASPLIPASGPLSHNDAIVPSQRPSMQSLRDNEIDEDALSRSRKPSIDLRAAAGGALGGLAAMIGFDALREKKNGLPPKDDPVASALGLVPSDDVATQNAAAASTTSVNTATPAAPIAAAEPVSNETLLPRRTRRQGSKASVLTGATSGESPSELPYTLEDGSPANRSAPAPAITGPLALGAGLGGLAAAAGVATGTDTDSEVKLRRQRSLKNKGRALAEDDYERTEANIAPVQTRDYAAPPSVVSAVSEIPPADDEVEPAYTAAPLNEKSGYSQLGMAAAAAAAPIAAVAAAAGTRKPKTLKDKSAKPPKGSRGVEKLPAVNEDGSIYRRPIPKPEKGGYLLTPSVAPSVADPLSVRGVGRRRPVASQGDWLSKDLSPQQTHYFIRELSARELRWELDRAFLLTSLEKPQRPSRFARKDLSSVEDDSRINDFDESSDEDLLAEDEDEDEEAVFRRAPQLGQGVYNQPTIPDLPLLRFLFKNAFCTFPLFVANEEKADQYVGGPPDKATLARNYFFTGILPLLRAIHTRSLSAWVDRHGEGDGTPFSAVSTTGSLRSLLTKWASRYVTAVLRVGPGDPYFEDDEPVEKESWPWPASNLLPPEAYYAFRKPLDRLKYGGYEVDLVGIRKHSSTERDYILRLRRPNAPDQYVVRNDNDFEEYRRNLAKDLSPYAFVKPLPRTRGRPDEGESDIEDGSPYGSERSEGFNAAGLGSAALYKSQDDRLGRKASERELRGGGRDGRRRYSSAKQNGRPVLGRDDRSEYGSEVFEDTADEKYLDDDDYSDATLQPRRGASRRGGRGGQAQANGKNRQSLLDKGKGSLRKLTGKESQNTSRNSSLRRKDGPKNSMSRQNSNRLAPPMTSVGGAGRPERASTSSRRPPAAGAMDFEARRNKLRTWLRDTLAVREAGHANETQNFLTIGGFMERNLRRSDYEDIKERSREDSHRRKEHGRDAAEAGDDVHDLRDVRDEIWFDCVEGDGFLKMYDSLRETPDYARLPLGYQKIVSWGNLQMARWLYGVFVAGDESRANLARVQDVYESVPWRKLAFAMKSPVAQMVRSWRDEFLRRGFLQSMLHVMLEDEPETIEEDLVELRAAIGSDVMFQKLRVFVDSPGDLKRLIRQHAEKAGVPLVAAIVRGSEQPKLNKIEVQRVMDASEAYQDFMKTLPSVTKKNNHKEPGYLLICNLQRALRLLSLQRDGAQVRGMLQDPMIADALTAAFEPLMEEVRRLHKVKGIGNAVMDLQSFFARLLDHLTGLRARVVDPLTAVNSIAEMLDDAAPAWYRFLHTAADSTPTVFSFFAWFRHLAMTIGAGSDDLAQIWTNPPAAPAAEEDEGSDGDRQSVEPSPEYEGILDPATMREINSLSEHGRRKRNRQMEIACRWAAGDTEEHHPVQIQGDGRGKTRSEPYMPREPRPARKAPGLDRFRKSFREAVSSALAR